MMKPITLIIPVMVLIFMMHVSVSADKANIAGNRVLVLGFKGTYLDDVQERIFRERIMRKLQTRGYDLVPVMEVESLVQDDDSLKIRDVGPGNFPIICERLRAAYALTGTLELVSPFTTLPEQEQKKLCQCKLVIYNALKGTTLSHSFSVPFYERMDEFFNIISEKITETVEKSGTVKKK